MVQDEVEKKVQVGQLVSVSAKDLLNMTHQEVQARRRQVRQLMTTLEWLYYSLLCILYNTFNVEDKKGE